jgi:polyisoprenoid-binding protein YceI
MKAERIWRRPNQLRPALPGSKEGGEARFRATARLDRTSFGVTKKKGMVGRTVDLVIDAVAEPA